MQAIVARVLAIGATSAAAAGAKRAAQIGWERYTGSTPPTAADVANDRDLRDLLIWAAVVTTSVAVARKLARSAAHRVA